MNTDQALATLSPSITTMIRADHAHVMTMFHRYRVAMAPQRKRRIVDTVCLALEIHAQLEEEIFYPALAEVAEGNSVLAKSQPEHDEMRRCIAELRGMAPDERGYDRVFLELMRHVVHHVADEETVLLPTAESLMPDDLAPLGARMTRRRIQLATPHTGELVAGTMATLPPSIVAMAVGSFAAGLVVALGIGRARR